MTEQAETSGTEVVQEKTEVQVETDTEVQEKVEPVKPEPEKFVVKREIYGDPDIFDSPRFQFITRYPEGAESTIWSMKIGTDIRQVLNKEEIYGDGSGSLNHAPLRSPNNRYVAFPLTGGGSNKIIFDLKTRERIVVGGYASFPNMDWTPDSKKLILDLNGTKEFNVETRELKLVDLSKREDYIMYRTFRINSKTGEIFLEGGNRKEKKDIVAILNSDWSLKKSYDIRSLSTTLQISPDGTKLLGKKGSKRFIFDFITGKKISENELGARAFCFGPDSKYFYFKDYGMLSRCAIDSSEIEHINEIPLNIRNATLTIFNY